MNKRAYKYRFYPTHEQEKLLAQTFGCTRFIYNTILRWRTDAYYKHQQKIGYKEASAELTKIKRSGEFDWLNDVSSVPLQQSLRHQQAAFKNFFEGRAKYPVFKKKSHRQSCEFTKSAFKYNEGKLYIAKSKDSLNIKWSRSLPSDPSSITISKDCVGRYFVSILCEFEPEKLPINTRRIGIDLGIKSLFVTSNGDAITNPRHTKRHEDRLALLQRRLSKKKLGSKNREKAKLKVAKLHAKISDSRMDYLHKQSRKLVNENQVVCIESLKVKNMMKNPKLSKQIADAGWGMFTQQLTYKAEWAGRELVKIDQFFPSSKRCSNCGYTKDKLSLSERSWKCPECGSRHDRDINAAKNIRAAGQAVLALGENVNLTPA